MKKILFLLIIYPVFLVYAKTGCKSSIDWNSGLICSEAVYSIKTDENGFAVDYSQRGSEGLNTARKRAYLEAKKLSRELISEQLKTIRIDFENTFEDILKESEYTRINAGNLMDEKIRSRQIPAGFNSAKSVSTLKISDLISALPFQYPNNDFPDYGRNIIPTNYSSVVIDTRGLEIEPMIFPSIYTEDGIEIFGKYFIDIQYAYKNGLVSYCYNEKEARKHKKTGTHPYYTVALKNLKNSPVIANEDANRILAGSSTKRELKKCKVIFIIDRK